MAVQPVMKLVVLTGTVYPFKSVAMLGLQEVNRQFCSSFHKNQVSKLDLGGRLLYSNRMGVTYDKCFNVDMSSPLYII